MSLGYILDEVFLGHRAPGPHPERPERLVAIRKALTQVGLEQRARQLPLREAREEELACVHTPAYLAELERTVPGRAGWLDGDTFFSPQTWRAARAAAAAAIDLTVAVLNGDVRRGLVLVRPPGHHAEADRAMGFCLLNNAAVAAGISRAGGVNRVAIIDWDVHHGNGTQHIFETDAAVLYASLHQFPLYPGTGASEEVGRGAGAGATLNVALPPGCGDRDYIAAWDFAVAPVVRRFRPDLILVSGGFDAFADDPLAQMQVTVEGFGLLGERACALADELCDGRLVCLLEGGYDLAGLGASVAAVFEAMVAPGRHQVVRPVSVAGPAPAAESAIAQTMAAYEAALATVV